MVPRAPSYLLAVIRALSESPQAQLPLQQSYETIVQTALAIERDRETRTKTRIFTGRTGKAYGKLKLQSMYTRTIQLGTRSSFGLFTRTDDIVRPGPNLTRYRSSLMNPETCDRTMLHLFVKAAATEDNVFRPSRFLIAVRNFVVQTLKLTTRASGTFEGAGTQEQGIVYIDDSIFRREVIRTDAPSFTTIAHWARYFELVETFNDTLIIDGKAVRTRCLFLPKHMATLQELQKTSEMSAREEGTIASKLGLTAYAARSVKEVAVGIAGSHRGVDLDLLRSEASNLVLVDHPEGGVLEYAEKRDFDPSLVFIFGEPQVPLEDFYRTLQTVYAKQAPAKEFIHVGAVMREVCKSLRISRSKFNQRLGEVYRQKGPRLISLERGFPKHAGEDYVELFGTSFFYIRVSS